MQLLVGKLQEALNLVERFPLVLSESSLAESGSSGLKALTQPFKLRLQRAAGTSAVLKEYASNVVLIEPLATAAAIEDFLWPKVRRESGVRHGAREPALRVPEVSGSGSQGLDAGSRRESGGAPERDGGSSGKQPVRADKGRASGKERSSHDLDAAGPAEKQREVGLFLSGFEDCGDGEVDDDEGDGELDEEEEGDEEEDDGTMLSSPSFSAYHEPAGTVHDLQLNPPDCRLGATPSKGHLPFQLPHAAAGGARRCTARNGAAPEPSCSGAVSTAASTAASTASSTAPRSQPCALNGGASSRAAAGAEATPHPSAAQGQPNPAAEGRGHNLCLLLNGSPLPYSMTIFQAIRQFGLSSSSRGAPAAAPDAAPAGALPSSIGQRLWGDVYTIHYRLASDMPELDAADAVESSHDAAPPAAAPAAERQVTVSAHDADPLLCRLGGQRPTVVPPSDPSSSVLQLLCFLQALCDSWHCLYSAAELAEMGVAGAALPASALLNRKLNAKLMRQLQDPLALCSRSLPDWCSALTSNCAFLFTFESRRLFLHSTAFGLSRALQRLQQHSRERGPVAGSHERSESRLSRLPRQKVRISRSRVMDSAFKVMELYASHKALLEVEYFGEVGTGLGPTLEFYTLVSLELRRADLGLWLSEEAPLAKDGDDVDKTYAYTPFGLYPRPVPQGAAGDGIGSRTTQLFTFIGRFVAKAMLDNRLVDLPFSTVFYRYLLGHELGMADLASISPQMSRSLKQLQDLAMQYALASAKGALSAEQRASLTLQGVDVADLGLDFTLPGYPHVELVPRGAEREVTLDNLSEYVQLVLQTMLHTGVRGQMEAFGRGFSEVFGVERLRAFSPDELDLLFNGARESWERDVVIEQLKFDHGYTRSSQAVVFLLEILSELSEPELRQFLRFVTGSPRLPVGGLARLSPRLTIVQKRPENGVSPDAYLPSVMTCANYLKLPDYSSKAVMKERLLTAISEGQGCFLLS
mmetsp:Transcript_15857/g.33917  ORF Transcript_15857/g.33917 Transcript_15857/m.33917 type:complete len:980 (-) Transcript_15857:729-3668(-)